MHKYSTVVMKRPFGKECIPSFGKALKDSDKEKRGILKISIICWGWWKRYLNLNIWWLLCGSWTGYTSSTPLIVILLGMSSTVKQQKWLIFSETFNILYLMSNFLTSQFLCLTSSGTRPFFSNFVNCSVLQNHSHFIQL